MLSERQWIFEVTATNDHELSHQEYNEEKSIAILG
jgi:hypothetical protein